VQTGIPGAGTAIAFEYCMNSQTQFITEEIHGNTPGHQKSFSASKIEPLLRYAWLEQEDELWHFLASPFASPAESTRKWPDEREALDELEHEGWKVVGPYPGQFLKESGSILRGYGLKRIIH
jgi:hypothetical protein